MSYRADDVATRVADEFINAITENYQKELTSVDEKKSNALLDTLKIQMKHIAFSAALDVEKLK